MTAKPPRPQTANPQLNPNLESSAFEVKPLLWERLKPYIYPSEVEEVKSIIGSHQIETNEGLQSEVRTWLEIWPTFRQSFEQKVSADRITPRIKLPEPAGRELLERNICMLIQELQKKAEAKGEDTSKAIPIESSSEKDIVNYLNTKPPSSRPRTASRGNLRDSSSSLQDLATSPTNTDIVPIDTRRPLSAKSSSSVMSTIDVEKIKQYLNIYDVKHFANELQEALKQEEKILLEDIDYLHKVFEDEWLYQTKYLSYTDYQNIPSLQDLRKFGVKLEKKVIESEAPSSPTLKRERPLSGTPPPSPLKSKPSGSLSSTKLKSLNTSSSLGKSPPQISNSRVT